MPSTSGKFMRYFLAFVISGVLSACSVSARVDYENHEGMLSQDFFHDLRDDKTDTDWVLANLGEPFHIQQYNETVSVYTWQLERAKYKHASLFFVLRYNTVEREQEYLHIISRDGIVRKHWLDNSPGVQSHFIEKVAK